MGGESPRRCELNQGALGLRLWLLALPKAESPEPKDVHTRAAEDRIANARLAALREAEPPSDKNCRRQRGDSEKSLGPPRAELESSQRSKCNCVHMGNETIHVVMKGGPDRRQRR